LKNLKGGDNVGYLGVGGKIILECILNNKFNWFRIRSSAIPCEYGAESLGSIKGGELVERLSASFSRRTVLHGFIAPPTSLVFPKYSIVVHEIPCCYGTQAQ
jgi:hypothetical protein